VNIQVSGGFLLVLLFWALLNCVPLGKLHRIWNLNSGFGVCTKQRRHSFIESLFPASGSPPKGEINKFLLSSDSSRLFIFCQCPHPLSQSEHVLCNFKYQSHQGKGFPSMGQENCVQVARPSSLSIADVQSARGL